MEKLLHTRQKPYYETENEQLYLGDSFRLLLKMEPESVDMIFADPPYFLSNDGVTCQGGKMVSVNKGEWDQGMDCGSKHAFNRRWLRLCKKVLKPDGTIWISGTLHNIYSIGMAWSRRVIKSSTTSPGRKPIRRRIWPAAASLIPRKPFSGRRRRIGNPITFSIMS